MISAHNSTPSQKVVVAVRAEKKEISRNAVAWALTHIVRPGDCLTLLAVLSDDTKSGVRKRWRFPKFNGDCGSSHRDKAPTDQIFEISQSCSQMVLQFNDQNQVGVRIKVVSGSPAGVVASESKKAGARWVVLDKHLKEEEKQCMEKLHCNIVAIKRSQARVLRVNMGSSDNLQPFSTSPSMWEHDSEELLHSKIKHSTPVSSPENLKTSLTITTTTEASSISSSDVEVSSGWVCEQNPLFEKQKKERAKPLHERVHSDDSFASSGTEGEGVGFLTTKPRSMKPGKGSVYWIPQNHIVENEKIAKDNTSTTLSEKFIQIDRESRIMALRLDRINHIGHVFNSDVRDLVSLSRSSSAPPPLCSLCQNKAPVFGKPPRWFDYRELEEATDRFSQVNSLAEGGLGSIHRGILRDGQVIAVKQLHVNEYLGDAEFCREVGVLSCAQHRNVVMLIGFCMEGQKRILVYEYVCNGSLDYHLYGGRRDALDWQSRVKIAIGTARGLRYLHEDCRVGCIVHRDVHPNNILLTHDFEALVGDFGVGNWRPELDLGEAYATNTFGYFAPKNVKDAEMTEKADVFAFGLVLRELITGRKITDMTHTNRQQFLARWYNHLLALQQQGQATEINSDLVDPCLDTSQLQKYSHQLQAMARAASLCLRQDPQSRPPMSKVLRTIEGANTVSSLAHSLDIVGNRSGRLTGLSSNQRIIPKHTRRLSR